ncbi:MAG: HPr(Ser) kinase/phosphatase [Thiomargarita sp.]|nr:HPr(Ser) kinase/phosphatase [Thiomargarita sp.]
MIQLSIDEFFKTYANNLKLSWVAGRTNKRVILLQIEKKLANIGYFNLIHPHQIEIIGHYEYHYLDNLAKKDYVKILSKLFKNKDLTCLIIVESFSASQDLINLANEYSIPIFTSSLSGEIIVNHLQTILRKSLAQRITLHGVFMDVLGIGVLIMGKSGIGKSELALELVSSGHRLIADDAPEFFLINSQTVRGESPFDMSPFLEVRGLGILNIQALFGNSAIRKSKCLTLIIQLEYASSERLNNIDRLQGDYRTYNVLEVEIPTIGLPVAPSRNLAVLVECAIRNYNLKQQGYNAADDFCEQQQHIINNYQ